MIVLQIKEIDIRWFQLFRMRWALRLLMLVRDVLVNTQLERKHHVRQVKVAFRKDQVQISSLHIKRCQVHDLHRNDTLDLFAFVAEKSRDDVAFDVMGLNIGLHSDLWNLGDIPAS